MDTITTKTKKEIIQAHHTYDDDDGNKLCICETTNENQIDS